MSQKKRVRVYKPGGNVAPYVNTDHFSNYFFEAGGPVDQGMQQAPMQQGQDQSQDLQNVVMMYAQSKGLAEEETQQLFQTILNMQPEEQAQVLAKIQAELTQGMQANPMLERGGALKRAQDGLNTNSIFYNQYLKDLKDAENYNSESAKIMFDRRNHYYDNYLRRKSQGVPEEENLKTFNSMINCIDGQCDVPIPTYAQLSTPPLPDVSFEPPVEQTNTPVKGTESVSSPQRFMRNYNPYTQTYEPMSPEQYSKLSRAHYLGQPEPQFDPILMDAITHQVVTDDQMNRYPKRMKSHNRWFNTTDKTFEDDSKPSIERTGGFIKSTKKLLNKKIGGISPNATKDNVIGDRKATVENAIGRYMMRNINDEVANEQMQQIPSYDIGGITGQWYGGGMGNAYTEDYQNRRQGMLGDVNEFLGNAKDWYSNIAPDFSQGFKVKTKGPMFNNPADISSQPPSANQLTQNEAAEQIFGLKYGGDIPTYQTAGTTIDIGTGKYDPVTKTITGTDGTTRVVDEDEAKWIMSQVQFGNASASTNNTTATNTNNTTATNSNLNGWRGGVFWQDGRAVTTIADMATGAAGAGSGFDYSSLFTPGKHIIPANQMANIFTQQGINRLANTFKGMQPDDVYLSKAKAKMGPFGAKAVLKWEYGPDGTPRQVAGTDEDNQSSSRFPTIGGNNFIDRTRARIQSRRTPSTGGDIPVGIDTPVPNATPTPASMQTPMSQSSGSGMGSMEGYDEMGNPIAPPTANPVYAPVQSNPRQSMEDLGEFAIGGRAGKMVIKPAGYNVTGHHFAPFITSAMDMGSSFLDMPMENEAMLTADAMVPTMYNDPLSRGLHTEKGAYNVEMTPQLKPLNQGDRFAQGRYEGPYFSKYGGDVPSYQDAGTTQTAPGQFYSYALGEKKYFLDNPETWKEDPEMQNADGSFNLCLDCLNVDYNDPATVQDVVRLINEGHSQLPHHSADIFAASLQKFGINPPASKKYGGNTYEAGGMTGNFEEGQFYDLDENDINDIINNGGTVKYIKQ